MRLRRSSCYAFRNTRIMKTLWNKVKPQLALNKRLAFLTPYIIGSALFIVVPVVLLFVKASTHVEGENNWDVVKDKTTWEIIGRSVWLGLTASMISLVIALPFAYSVARSESKIFKAIAISLIISPLFIFSIAKVFSLRVLLLQMFDHKQEALQHYWVMIVGMVYLYMPFMIIPLYSVLSQMPASLMEASKDLGYGSIATLFKVVIPYALKAIFSGLAIVFMLSATTLVINQSLLKNDSIEYKMIGNSIDDIASQMRNTAFGAVNGSMLALMTICIMMSVYAGIYLIPQVIRKIRGGINV